jgi:hypothetical protein
VGGTAAMPEAHAEKGAMPRFGRQPDCREA